MLWTGQSEVHRWLFRIFAFLCSCVCVNARSVVQNDGGPYAGRTVKGSIDHAAGSQQQFGRSTGGASAGWRLSARANSQRRPCCTGVGCRGAGRSPHRGQRPDHSASRISVQLPQRTWQSSVAWSCSRPSCDIHWSAGSSGGSSKCVSTKTTTGFRGSCGRSAN